MKINYLKSINRQFHYYKNLGDATFEQLSEQELLYSPSEDVNSISIIVKHIVGNQLSRWTNFLTEDGEKEWRHRDTEFEGAFTSKEAMLQAWENGWNCLFNALNEVDKVDLIHIVYIRNEGHTVLEAINRQLCHYSYHIGQIVHIGKTIKEADWKSLSIPKNASKIYNKERFTADKQRKHFTDNP
ncbi:DUF1572 domain-containing protein [Urechidicola sp. KH5]